MEYAICTVQSRNKYMSSGTFRILLILMFLPNSLYGGHLEHSSEASFVTARTLEE